MGDKFPSNCKDCGVDTTPGDGTPRRSDYRWEYYMVTDEIWKEAGMDGMDAGFLCIGCIEHRLGRRLTWEDFTNALVNVPGNLDTDRCYDRKTSDDELLNQMRMFLVKFELDARGYNTEEFARTFIHRNI